MESLAKSHCFWDKEGQMKLKRFILFSQNGVICTSRKSDIRRQHPSQSEEILGPLAGLQFIYSYLHILMWNEWVVAKFERLPMGWRG